MVFLNFKQGNYMKIADINRIYKHLMKALTHHDEALKLLEKAQEDMAKTPKMKKAKKK
jgi:hypothetical protein